VPVDPLAPWGPVTPVAYDNDGYYDSDAVLSPDGLELYFSTIGGTLAPGIARSTRDSVDGPWGPAALVEELNVPRRAQNSKLTADGLAIYVAIADDEGDLDTYRASRETPGDAWSTPVLVPELTTDLDNFMTSPCLDETRFIVSTPHGDSGSDLFEVADGAWRRLDEVETDARDFTPFVTEDCLTLYFASDREIADQFELYVAQREAPEDRFGAPQLVDVELDVGEDSELMPWVSADGRHLLLTRRYPAPESMEIWEAFR
jgi:hypothetical protein